MKESSLLDLKQMARELSDLEKRIWGSREERFRFVARQTAILDALDLEKLFWGSEEERFHYIAQLKVTRDALDIEARFREIERRLEEAVEWAEGRAEGEAKGRAEGRADTALRMIAHGMDTASVALFTGLEPVEIEALREAKERPEKKA